MNELISAASDAEKLGLIGILIAAIIVLIATVYYLFRTCCKALTERYINHIEELNRNKQG